MLGIDVYDCVMVIRSQKALDAFATHKVTIGGELGVAAGPYGIGIAVESGIEKAPLLSYIRSRGAYAGVEMVGQVFLERFDENAAMYKWPGIKAGDIVGGFHFTTGRRLITAAFWKGNDSYRGCQPSSSHTRS
jgi:lipid-binding SYLF domain-containing protein